MKYLKNETEMDLLYCLLSEAENNDCLAAYKWKFNSFAISSEILSLVGKVE